MIEYVVVERGPSSVVKLSSSPDPEKASATMRTIAASVKGRAPRLYQLYEVLPRQALADAALVSYALGVPTDVPWRAVDDALRVGADVAGHLGMPGLVVKTAQVGPNAHVLEISTVDEKWPLGKLYGKWFLFENDVTHEGMRLQSFSGAEALAAYLRGRIVALARSMD